MSSNTANSLATLRVEDADSITATNRLAQPLLTMGAGTPSFGGRNNKSHTICRRCGSRSLHIQKGVCAKCGYPEARMRHFAWGKKAHLKRSQGTGKMSHLKVIQAKLAAANKH